jgi:hypothetical protein
MTLTEEQAKLRVERSSKIVRKRAPNMPVAAKVIVGAAGLLSQYSKASRDLGLSYSAVESTTNGRFKNPEAKAKLDKLVDNIQETAALKLVEALGLITPEKMENAKLRDLSSVAADMARILEKTSNRNNQVNQTQNQVIIYAPRTKDEDEFKVIVG